MKVGMLVVLGALSLAGAGCDGSTEIPGGRYLQNFFSTRVDSVFTEGISTQTGARTIILNGRFEAPTGCQNLDPQVDDDDREITVTITSTPQSSNCQSTTLGYYRYTVLTGYFFPGTYHFEVIHKDARGQRTVFSQNVGVQF